MSNAIQLGKDAIKEVQSLGGISIGTAYKLTALGYDVENLEALIKGKLGLKV